jgi:hypothetical protein
VPAFRAVRAECLQVEEGSVKITKHYSLLTADKVLTALRKVKPPKLLKGSEIGIAAWSNGREQGYYLRYYSPVDRVSSARAAVVAQQRNSDAILVVAGTPYEFDFQTNQPDDGAWEHRAEFHPRQYEAAARYIMSVFSGRRPLIRAEE